MANSRMSRPGTNKRVRFRKAATVSSIVAKKLQLSTSEFESSYAHITLPGDNYTLKYTEEEGCALDEAILCEIKGCFFKECD